jgi:hypothetical protein
MAKWLINSRLGGTDEWNAARLLWFPRKNQLLGAQALLADGFLVDKRSSHVLKSKSVAVKEFTLNRCPA